MKLDSYFIKFDKSTPEEIKIKCKADGQDWRDIPVSLEEMRSPNIKEIIKNKVSEIYIAPGEYLCPVCGVNKKSFLRRYFEYWFCGFCGAHLRLILEPENHLELVAKIE